MSLSNIKTRIESQVNPITGVTPYLTRGDIEDVISIINSTSGGINAFNGFLNSLTGFTDQKLILADINSYTQIL